MEPKKMSAKGFEERLLFLEKRKHPSFSFLNNLHYLTLAPLQLFRVHEGWHPCHIVNARSQRRKAPRALSFCIKPGASLP